MTEKATKSKIIEKMFQLVAEKGYEKASIGLIAESIGIKKASIYYYFKSKEDIFLQLVEKLYADDYSDNPTLFREGISGIEYRDELKRTGEKFIESYYKNQNLRKAYAEIDIQMSRIAALKAFVIAADEKFNEFLIKCVERAVEAGAVPKTFDTKINAQILYAVLNGIDQAILYDLPIDPKAVWNKLIDELFCCNIGENLC